MKNKKAARKIKFGLYGGSGKMGLEIQGLLASSQHEPYLCVASEASKIFSITVASLNNIEPEIMSEVDVWIDFSSAAGLSKLLTEVKNKPIVSGSTGLTAKHFANLKTYSKKAPVFWASNMSIGLWCFRQALKNFSVIADFDFAIDEIHHNQKKDNPSGTALTLQQDVEKSIGKKIQTPTAHRIGGVFGIHTVHAASANEIISFKHQALNRKVFAQGAVQAAEWLTEQKNGFYSMDDMLSKKGQK